MSRVIVYGLVLLCAVASLVGRLIWQTNDSLDDKGKTVVADSSVESPYRDDTDDRFRSSRTIVSNPDVQSVGYDTPAADSLAPTSSAVSESSTNEPQMLARFIPFDPQASAQMENADGLRPQESRTQVVGATSSPFRLPQSNHQQPSGKPPIGLPEHEWIFITNDDRVLTGDLDGIADIRLQLKYGSVVIPFSDIVSISRAPVAGEASAEKPESPSNALGESHMPEPSVEREHETKRLLPPSPEIPTNPHEPSVIAVATKDGSILVGTSELANFSARTQWGSMTIEAKHLTSICNRASGLKRLEQSANGTQEWGLFPLQLDIQLFHVSSQNRNSLPPPGLPPVGAANASYTGAPSNIQVTPPSHVFRPNR
jgi:hypothetical protein